MKRLPLRTGWLAAAALLLETGTAAAYCRTHSCDPSDPSQICDVDKNDCVTSGVPLYWASDCVSFGVQQDGSVEQGIDAETVSAVTERAFSHWLDVSCSGDPPSLNIGKLGPLICAESRYNEHGKNANIVIFRDGEWPYPGAVDTYAFTRVRFDTQTGEIFDADIEINSADFELSTNGKGDGTDLESILTHEIGHFLGLAHAAPEDDTSTMRAGWNGEGLDLRTPSADDGEGLCAIYPPDREPASTSCEPRHGFSSECNVPVEAADEAGCTFARRPWRASDVALLVGLFGVIALRRRRHRLDLLLTRSPHAPDNRQNSK